MRAQKEWRGRPASDFDVVLGDGLALAPFFAQSADADAAGAAVAQMTPREANWTQVSNLAPLGQDLALAAVMAELEGGAQGLAIDATQLPLLVGAGAQVKFDFVQLIVYGELSLETLAQVIPTDQRPRARVLALSPSKIASGSNDFRAGAVEAWPLLSHGRRVSVSDSLRATVYTALGAMQTALGKQIAGTRPGGAGRFAISVAAPVQYLQTVILIATLRLLWTRVCTAGEVDPLPLEVYVEIGPRPDVVQTPEAYLIDASTRAVAAVSAGVAGLIVKPYSVAPDHLRQARNLQHVLSLEAGLGRHGDAVTGAQFIEEGARLLADAAWTEHLPKDRA